MREEKARVASAYDAETLEDEHTTSTSSPVGLAPAHGVPADSAIITQPRISKALAYELGHNEPVSILSLQLVI